MDVTILDMYASVHLVAAKGWRSKSHKHPDIIYIEMRFRFPETYCSRNT